MEISAIRQSRSAGKQLNCELNPNAFLARADHRQLAIDRERGGVALDNPLAHEVAYGCAREYDVAKRARALSGERGYALSDGEACSIVLRIARAKAEGGTFSDNTDNVMKTVGIVDEIIASWSASSALPWIAAHRAFRALWFIFAISSEGA